jgi:hypothetical protein
MRKELKNPEGPSREQSLGRMREKLKKGGKESAG